MNATLAIFGSVVAGPLRAAHGVDALLDSLFVFFYLTLVVVVEARLWFLSERFAAGQRGQIEEHSSNNPPDIQNSSVVQGLLADRPALVAVECGDEGEFRTASDTVAIALEAS
jgi:hypothetical protein